MKRNINTRTSALATLAMLALSSTLLAQEPSKPRLRPADTKPANEEAAKQKEEGVLRGGAEKPAPQPEAKPVGKDRILPRGGEIPIIKGDKKDPGEPGIVKGEPVKTGDKKDPGEPGIKGGGTPKGDKKDPGEPGVVKGEPVKTGDKKDPGEPGIKGGGTPKGDKKDPGEPGVKDGADPKGDMKKPSGSIRNGEVPPRKSSETETVTDSNASVNLPSDFDASVKRKFDSLEHQDLSLPEFTKIEREDAERIQALKLNPNARYIVKAGQGKGESACGNGDFEPRGLKLEEWTGGYGKINSSTNEPDYANFATGILPGLLTSATARHTTTNTGIDPNVGIQQTGPDVATSLPSAHAVRIGNAVNGFGAELLSKTFTVTSSEKNIRFWYAVVLQNPTGHPLNIQPAFQVRVLSGGVPISGLVDLGNGSGKLIADSSNPFFKTKMLGSEPLVYKDWSCAQINLSALVGKTVTVQFITQDCGAGGHWGYAYIDNICGKCTNSPTGDIKFNSAKSSNCGPGNICFDYSLPKDGNKTGTGVIALNLYQAGNLTPVATLTSPTLTAGTSYCFAVNPSTIAGLNASLGGFDFSGTGTFTLGTNVTKLTDEGKVVGNNNDYQIKCDGPPPQSDSCCGGTNLVLNGEMDVKGEAPRSAYEALALGGKSFLPPGSFMLTDVAGLSRACPNWTLPAACKATKDFSGGVMLVNGLTNQAQGKTGMIFEQKLSLPKPEKGEEAEYKICFRYLPLPACCFDVVPKLTVVVSKGGGAPITLTNVSDIATGCGHLYSANFKATPGTVSLQILLAEDGRGDGNDLMLDNVSVRQLVEVPSAPRMFNLTAADAGGGNYHITLTAPGSLTNPPYNWAWEVWDPATNTVISTVGGSVATTDFGSMNFSASKQYLFKLKVWSPCHALSGSKQTWSFDPVARKAQQQPDEDPNPEPVKASALK